MYVLWLFLCSCGDSKEEPSQEGMEAEDCRDLLDNDNDGLTYNQLWSKSLQIGWRMSQTMPKNG